MPKAILPGVAILAELWKATKYAALRATLMSIASVGMLARPRFTTDCGMRRMRKSTKRAAARRQNPAKTAFILLALGSLDEQLHEQLDRRALLGRHRKELDAHARAVVLRHHFDDLAIKARNLLPHQRKVELQRDLVEAGGGRRDLGEHAVVADVEDASHQLLGHDDVAGHG